MSRHTTHRGTTIDMDSIRRENENSVALGNMNVNARGDRIEKGLVTKTADELARENHRVTTTTLRTGLKGPIDIVPAPEVPVVDKEKVKPVKQSSRKEKELPNGDIVEDTDE